MNIIFDVGANDGRGTEVFLQDPNNIVYAFEPTWELLHNFMWPLARKYNNLRVIPFAVDVDNSFKTFNIAGQSDWGCSSLHEFSEGIHEQWPNRPDFKVTHQYIVPTIRMDTFCGIYNIDKINYLEIDTQGNDLNVLKSFGDKIDIVQQGVLEASAVVKLYQGVDNDIDNIRSFLTLNNFDIISEIPNDYLGAEINMQFKKNDR